MRSFAKIELKRLISLLKPGILPYTCGLIGCGIIDAGAATLVTTFAAKDAVDAATEKNMGLIINASVKLGISAFLLLILVPLFNYLFSNSINKIMASIRINLFEHMVKLPVGYFESTHSGDSISRLTNDAGVIENAITNIRSIISLALTGIFSCMMMLFLDWRMAIVLIVLALISTFINLKFSRYIRKLSNILQKNAGLLTERFIDLLSGFTVIKMFNIYGIIFNQYKGVNDSNAKISSARFLKLALQDSSNFILMWLCNGGTLIVGSFMIINGQCSLGTLLAMILLIGNVTNLARNLGNYISQLQSSMAGAARIFELLDIDPEPERYDTDAKREECCVTGIRDGRFNYVEGECVIDGITLMAEKGSKVAIVGPSGSGKSTIIKLILGFYPLDSGSVVIDGTDSGEYTLAQLREKVAYISQDSYLFEGTIEENIRYGRIDASHNDIVMAAKAAKAHQFIMEQPEGYDTMVGERGAKLSGGQKQRLAIARALLKDAPILLLDEATSALDSESEQLVQESLNRLMEGRTTITIAHRLSTIKQSDIIYVIDKGKIVEHGEHDELLLLRGLYSRLYDIQFGSQASSVI